MIDALRIAAKKTAEMQGKQAPLWTRIPSPVYLLLLGFFLFLTVSSMLVSLADNAPEIQPKECSNLNSSFATPGGLSTIGGNGSAGFVGAITPGCSAYYGSDCPGSTYPEVKPPATSKVVYPYPGGTASSTSGFGWRIHPVLGSPQFHAGGDIAQTGPFNSVADGIVVKVYDANNGDSPSIVVKHNISGKIYFSTYLHWDHPVRVKVGDTVKAGQPLAETGTRGRSTGVHLHLEIGEGGESNVIDPNAFFSQHGALNDYVPDGQGGQILATQSMSMCENMSGGFLTDGARKVIIDAARSQLGVQYVWGGQEEGKGFDCSGLTQWAYRKAGVTIPRTADEQYMSVTKIPRDKAQPGDLAFFTRFDPELGRQYAYHVAIYIGNNQIIHAPDVGYTLTIASADGYVFGRPAGLPDVDGKGGDPESNKALAKSMMSAYWNSPREYGCLVDLWTRESSWNHTAKNPSSGAYGIPQSLPANKMASAGADYLTNPKTQIKWGLDYIKGRYGSPCNAISHHDANNWY